VVTEVELESREVKYQQILVKPEKAPLQVTFDDSKNAHYWSYQQGSNSIHITEIFHLESAGGSNVKILGYLPPKKTKTKWYLSILENLSGVTERYPKFRPTEDVVESDYLHTVFTIDVDGGSGRAALSFKTKHDSRTVYFVPSSDELKQIEITEDPDNTQCHVFEFGEMYTEMQLRSFAIGWETICQDPE
jgi:hypothetical protein